ncbi:MAG: ABC transporter permease [Planctomycetota bacterium]
MRTILVLVRSHLVGHKVRTLLTTLATACSVSLLIWVISLYTSAIRSLDLYASRALGHYALIVDPISRKFDREVMPEAVDLLRERTEVESADPMWARLMAFRPLTNNSNDLAGNKYSREGGWEEVIVATDASQPPFELLRGRWTGKDESESLEVVVSKDFGTRLGVDVGDQLEIPGPTENRPRLSIVGVMEPPPPTITGAIVGSRMLPSPSVGAVFCSMDDARIIHGTDPTITFVAVSLNEGVDVHDFRYQMMPELYALPKPSQFMTDLDLEEEMSEAAKASSIALQAYVIGMISMLLAFLVIFSTLSMGVSERTRQFAILRAVVLSKQQLVALISVEGIALTCLGLLVGIPVGCGLVLAFDKATEGVVRNGIGIHVTGILLAVLVSVLASLFASALPAWRATRVKPLDAISPLNSSFQSDDRLLSAKWLLVALPLLGLLPLLSFVLPPDLAESVFGRLMLGSVGLGFGLLLLAPILIRAVDRWCAPLLARIFGLPTELLQQQLTSQLWRTVACALTMSVGIGLFTGIHVWGWSMVQVFVPTEWAPEATLVFKRPISNDDLRQLREANPDVRIEPLIVEQPRLRDDVLRSAEFPSVTRQMVTVLAGIDPEVAFGSDSPLIDADWYAGSSEEAIHLMKTQRGCVVPDHFLKQSDLDIGDDLFLIPPENSEQPVRYVVAGAVHLRGGQWMTKTTNMRQRTHRSAGLVFANFDFVSKDFGLPGPMHCWVDAPKGQLDSQAVLQAAKSLSIGNTGSTETEEESVRLMMTADIGGQILKSAAFWLWFMSVVPAIAMGISSIAMINMFLASVRARQWDFGILRSIGYTRSTLVRIVIAEGLLVGVVACVVGCTFGLIAGWSGTALTQATSWFGGMDVALTVPGITLAVGCFVMLVFASFAAAWPALRIGLASPLTLLSQSRGSQ